jgi:hypothetical protein
MAAPFKPLAEKYHIFREMAIALDMTAHYLLLSRKGMKLNCNIVSLSWWWALKITRKVPV